MLANVHNTTPFYYHDHPVGENDVICGKKCERHPGNVAFRRIVHEFHSQYQATNARDVKKHIIQVVIQRVKENGGQFVKESDDQTTMENVSSQYIYEKVSHALRSAQISTNHHYHHNNNASTIPPPHQQETNPPHHHHHFVVETFDDLLATQQKLFYSYLSDSALTDPDKRPVVTKRTQLLLPSQQPSVSS